MLVCSSPSTSFISSAISLYGSCVLLRCPCSAVCALPVATRWEDLCTRVVFLPQSVLTSFLQPSLDRLWSCSQPSPPRCMARACSQCRTSSSSEMIPVLPFVPSDLVCLLPQQLFYQSTSDFVNCLLKYQWIKSIEKINRSISIENQ